MFCFRARVTDPRESAHFWKNGSQSSEESSVRDTKNWSSYDYRS